jgi:hypothetical protein
MTNRQQARPGDVVRILAMPAGIVRGLPVEDVEFLMRAVGDYATVQSLTAEKTAEVEISRPAENRIHFVWLNASDLEFIERGASG